MPENTATTPAACGNEIRESTCIHTKKIYDSCQAKDCVEDLRLYPTCSSQPIIDSAMSLRAGSATLLYVYMDVQPVGLGRGYYTVDMRFFYKITAEATAGCAKSPRAAASASERMILQALQQKWLEAGSQILPVWSGST